MTARLAVDIGGTFTDIALHFAGRTQIAKILTTHDAPERAFVAGTAEMLRNAGCPPESLEVVIHGTTLATNAIIERRGARTALLTTEGFRDVIEIADEGRYDQYDLRLVKPAPLVPRSLRFTVRERLDADGNVIRALDEQGVRLAAEAMRRAGAQAVAVCFLHSFRNAAHERRARTILAEVLPDVSISLSSEVCPEIREYERFSTTCANAYVQRIIGGYVVRLVEQLAALGVTCPLVLMTSGGGLASVDTARRLPIRLVESGPAGGAILSCEIARSLGLQHAVSLDVGGTTAKICLIRDGTAESARSFEVARTARFRKGSGLPLRIPVIELLEIGAGGGSIAAVDSLGGIRVGPQSAGSEPGPACYGRGGAAATVTDADVLLGRIPPSTLVGSHIELSARRAETAIVSDVADRLGLSPQNAALAICEMVDETMTNAARLYAAERGMDLAGHALIAFGGAAPLHAGRFAEKLGLPRIIVPPNAGVGSALGFLCAPIAFETVRSRRMLLREMNAEIVNEIFSAMYGEALATISGMPTAHSSSPAHTRHGYMRYVGQGHEVLVPFPARNLTGSDTDLIRAAFEERYCEAFKRTLPECEAEILTLVLRVELKNSLPFDVLSVLSQERAGALAPGQVRVYLPERGGFVDVGLYRRAQLTVGQKVSGPCIVIEPTTTTYVATRYVAYIDARSNLVLERRTEYA